MLFHACVRALVLIGLGIFLRSDPPRGNDPITNFTFVDTLTQIGLGYVFLFLLAFRSAVWHWAAAGLLLVAYWAWFATAPLPASDFDYTSVGVKADWPHHFVGFEAHWNINTNPAAAVDRWFLNIFPRAEEFKGNSGGYTTLNFVPTLATMLFGLIAGRWLYAGLPRSVLWGRLFGTGVVLLAAGYALDRFGICPLVKPIWTPSFALFSGGICFLMMLGFTMLFDGETPLRLLAYPLVILGANSILLYCMNALVRTWVQQTLTMHLKWPERAFGFTTYTLFGDEYKSIVSGGLVLLIFWVVLWWMYRKRYFVKI
jgi:predicted acyltransferase